MRHDFIEIRSARATDRTRRVWYGHGSSRLVTEAARDLPPAEVIDEAIAGFDGIESEIAPKLGIHSTWRPVKTSIVANLTSQLAALDHQRKQLVELLRTID